MTTTLSSKGQIVIPRAIRDRHELQPGDDFLLFELSNGDLLLRKVRQPKKSLIWHLRQLQGLRLERPTEKMRDIQW